MFNEKVNHATQRMYRLYANISIKFNQQSMNWLRRSTSRSLKGYNEVQVYLQLRSRYKKGTLTALEKYTRVQEEVYTWIYRLKKACKKYVQRYRNIPAE